MHYLACKVLSGCWLGQQQGGLEQSRTLIDL
jgi:hypothetical protein